jgi:hypothetical protein
MKVTECTPSASPDWRRTTFYRVELFQAGELAGIEFFDPHELALARQRALASVERGGAERAEVHDDTGTLVFAHPQARDVAPASENGIARNST